VQIVDRFASKYAVKRWPLVEGALVYYVLALRTASHTAKCTAHSTVGCGWFGTNSKRECVPREGAL